MRIILLILLLSCAPKPTGDNMYSIEYEHDIGFYPIDYLRLVNSDFYLYDLDTDSIKMTANRNMNFVFVHYVVVNDSIISFMVGNGFNGIDYVTSRQGDKYVGTAYEYWGYPQPYDSTKVVISQMK